MEQRLFGLIGYPLSHSFSKKYFTEKFEKEKLEGCRYELFPIPTIDLFPELWEANPYLVGLNVTIPYKESVSHYVDHIDPKALTICAINCIRKKEDKLIGFNTDVDGFESSLIAFLKKNQVTPNDCNALVLGTGGAAKAVWYILEKWQISFVKVSRFSTEYAITYKELTKEIIRNHRLIIQTTPLGMSPNISTKPDIPYDFLTKDHLLFDLVYNPLKTAFLREGELRGASIQNGLDMLYGQAESAWCHWSE